MSLSILFVGLLRVFLPFHPRDASHLRLADLGLQRDRSAGCGGGSDQSRTALGGLGFGGCGGDHGRQGLPLATPVLPLASNSTA